MLALHMREHDSLALLGSLVAAQADPHVVFVAGAGDVRDAVRAMKEGAVDVLPAPVAGPELLDAVERALALDGAARARRAWLRQVETRLATLTRREREVCDLVAEGLLNKQIAQALGPSEKTVKVHRARALRKLEVESVAALVRLLDGVHASGLTPGAPWRRRASEGRTTGTSTAG